MNILVMAPMQQELDWFLEAGSRRGYAMKTSTSGKLPIVQLIEPAITLARGGTGKAQFAVHTQHLLDCQRAWELVICVGGAGGLVDDLAVGDVVVATTTIEHDYHNKFNRNPTPSFEGAATIIAQLQCRAAAYSFKVHFGKVASGDEDVIDERRRKALHQTTHALAVAWEGAGGARACQFSGVPFIEIRGITDSASLTAPADFESNLAVAMSNVASVVFSLSDQ